MIDYGSQEVVPSALAGWKAHSVTQSELGSLRTEGDEGISLRLSLKA